MNKFLLFLCLTLISCKNVEYVKIPIETIKTEYKNKLKVDTIFLHDSVVRKEKRDTVFLEKYRYVYRTRELRDTMNIVDTIPIIQTIETVKTVNKLHNWQIVLMILGGGFMILIGYKLLIVIKK